MIIKLPNGCRCDIGSDLDSLYVIHEVFYLGNYDSLLIRSTDSVLDCGAHIGIFALKVAALCSHVVAVEPASSNFNLLQKNIKLNELEKKIVPIKRIIHAKSGIFARLYLAEKGGRHSIYNTTGTVSEISETISVDDLSTSLGVKFDVIKIDVEGAEVDLLRGAKQTLACSREVIMEYHSRKLLKQSVKILRAHGFHCE
jgi:FkbM family methyltransferase